MTVTVRKYTPEGLSELTGVETGSLLCHIRDGPSPSWTVTCDGHSVRHSETVRITGPPPQHQLPNRITQHNKLHKIIKLITTLNPGLMRPAQLTWAGIQRRHIHRHKREQSYKTREHRTAACGALILALIGFVNYVTKLTLSMARWLSEMCRRGEKRSESLKVN